MKSSKQQLLWVLPNGLYSITALFLSYHKSPTELCFRKGTSEGSFRSTKMTSVCESFQNRMLNECCGSNERERQVDSKHAASYLIYYGKHMGVALTSSRAHCFSFIYFYLSFFCHLLGPSLHKMAFTVYRLNIKPHHCLIKYDSNRKVINVSTRFEDSSSRMTKV